LHEVECENCSGLFQLTLVVCEHCEHGAYVVTPKNADHSERVAAIRSKCSGCGKPMFYACDEDEEIY
jgi:hypothetical protein